MLGQDVTCEHPVMPLGLSSNLTLFLILVASRPPCAHLPAAVPEVDRANRVRSARAAVAKPLGVCRSSTLRPYQCVQCRAEQVQC